MTHFKREIQFHVIRPITPYLVASVMKGFTTWVFLPSVRVVF